jgi:hypothetical protein
MMNGLGLVPALAPAILIAWIVRKIYLAVSDDLRSIPGPPLARFTRLWYLNAVHKGDFEKQNIELHRKLGKRPETSHCRHGYR